LAIGKWEWKLATSSLTIKPMQIKKTVHSILMTMLKLKMAETKQGSNAGIGN
jgi:hypothetical protein